MLKKTLIAATALSAVALGAASPASAHYKGHYNFSWYAGYPSWSYSICHYETRPLTLKIWDPYTYSYYFKTCLLYTSPSPRDRQKSRMPSSA